MSALIILCFSVSHNLVSPIAGVNKELKSRSTAIDNLDGKWELVSYTNEGVKKLATDRNTSFYGQRIAIKGERYFEWYDGNLDPPKAEENDLKFRCQIKAGMPFKHFDYWPVGADKKPDTWIKKGIFKLDGDRLLICFRVQQLSKEKSVLRPTDFNAAKGMRTGLAVYRRIKAK